MIIYSFGCSFIFGSDLHDDGRSGPIATPSKYTFPAMIAKHHGVDYECHARPGAGNFEILNRVMKEMQDPEPAIFMINWTWIDRFSFIDETKRTGRHPYNPDGWASILPTDEDDRAHLYYRELHTQIRDKLETLICIKSAIDNLRHTQRQFVMTWIDALIWDDQYHCPPSVAWMQQQIKPYLTDFDGTSFLDWSRQQGFEISEKLHPLEPAHDAAARHVLERWSQYIRS